MSNLGQPIPRADGPIQVTGAARYASDQNQPGQVHAVFVASTIPAGRVAAIDTKMALAMPGVVRVLVAADMPRAHADLDKFSVPPLATRFVPMQADDIVYEGQPVAIVLGETLEAAEAAAGSVRVTYERAAFTVPDTAPAEPADPNKGHYSMASKLDSSKGDAPAALAAASVGDRQHDESSRLDDGDAVDVARKILEHGFDHQQPHRRPRRRRHQSPGRA